MCNKNPEVNWKLTRSCLRQAQISACSNGIANNVIVAKKNAHVLFHFRILGVSPDDEKRNQHNETTSDVCASCAVKKNDKNAQTKFHFRISSTLTERDRAKGMFNASKRSTKSNAKS